MNTKDFLKNHTAFHEAWQPESMVIFLLCYGNISSICFSVQSRLLHVTENSFLEDIVGVTCIKFIAAYLARNWLSG